MFDSLKEQKELVTISVTQALKKSREVITQYVAMGSAFLTQYGNDILSAFNQNSPQIESVVPKMFGVLSVACAILAIYLKLTTKSVVVGKDAETPIVIDEVK